MIQSFTVGLREALQCFVLVLLFFGYPGTKARISWFVAGVFAAFAIGFPLSYIKGFAAVMPANETWTSFRYLTEVVILYLGVLFLALAKEPESKRLTGGAFVSSGLFILGFVMFFFEARAEGFLVHDIGLMGEAVTSTVLLCLLGTCMGFAIPVIFRKYLGRIPFDRVLTVPGLMVSVATLKFVFGGVGEIEDGNIIDALQRGFQLFVENAVRQLQEIFVLKEYGFLKVEYSSIAGFLSGDRTSTTLVILFLMIPPVYILIDLFATPDPALRNIQVAAQRRLKAAFFRAELMYKSIPALVPIVTVIVMLHAVNISANPMYDPMPMTLRVAEGDEGVLRIPLADRMGDLKDEKLRKYVYFSGNDRIVFLAIMKPDKTVGVALDECEICKPADWNKAAQGYAQRGEHLVCKYCMTPIPVPTVNKPGGCNPIPISFRLEDDNIVIDVKELARVHKEAKEMQKEGTHL